MQDMLCKPLPSHSNDLASKPICFLHRVWPKLGEAIPMKRALDWVSKGKAGKYPRRIGDGRGSTTSVEAGQFKVERPITH